MTPCQSLRGGKGEDDLMTKVKLIGGPCDGVVIDWMYDTTDDSDCGSGHKMVR